MASKYYYGQGKVWAATIDPITKLPNDDFEWLGNIPAFVLNFDVDVVEHNESNTGDRLPDLRVENRKNISGTVTFEEWDRENLGKILYAKTAIKTTASVTEEEHTAKIGYSFSLNNINIASFTSLTDDGATTTYVNGTDYSIDSKSGMITIPTGTSIADESIVEANYSFGQHADINPYAGQNIDRWFRFNGLNSADDNNPVIIDIVRARIMPPNTMELIGDEMSQLECELGTLYQEVLDVSGGDYEGGLMRIRKLK